MRVTDVPDHFEERSKGDVRLVFRSWGRIDFGEVEKLLDECFVFHRLAGKDRLFASELILHR